MSDEPFSSLSVVLPGSGPAGVAGKRRETAVNGRVRRGWSTPAQSTLRSLDDFVVGPCNQLAYTASRQLAEGAEGAAAMLFIHGECGVGKTHLLQGLCRRFAQVTGRQHGMRYVTGEQFTNEFIAAVRNNGIDAFRKRTRKLDLLAIDDVHFLANKVATQSEFLHTLDAIDLSGARIVLASDEHPRHIKRFSQALVSRFLSGMVVRIDPPARQTRVTLIARLAAERGLRLNDAATSALASRFVGSVRELEGAVTKLAALHQLSLSSYQVLVGGGRSFAPAADEDRPGPASSDEIGMVLVDQLLNDSTWRPKSPVRIAAVIDAVCGKLAVQRSDLSGRSRHRRVVLARSLVAHLGRELTTMSYPEIAHALGRDFHSTVHNAANRLRDQLARGGTCDCGPADPNILLCELVDQLKHDILRGCAAA